MKRKKPDRDERDDYEKEERAARLQQEREREETTAAAKKRFKGARKAAAATRSESITSKQNPMSMRLQSQAFKEKEKVIISICVYD